MNTSLAGIAEKNGKYFLALRKPGTTIGESWEFPGGKAEPGEDHIQTLKREYREEFSTSINVGNLLYKGAFSNKDRDFTLYAYSISFSENIKAHPEHQEYSWFSPEQFDSLEMADSDRMIADYIKKTAD